MREVPEASPRARGPSAGLALLCAGTNALEAGLAVAFHVGGGAEIAPQAAAAPPLALFSDLRWLLVYERSWLGFALAALLVLAGRSLLSALQLRLAWPGQSPPFTRLFARFVVFNLALGVLLSPFALLLFGLAAFRVSWLYFAAVPSALCCSLILHQAAFSRGWWRTAPRLRAFGWMAATIPVLMVAAWIVSLAPAFLAVPVAVASGWFEALVWSRIAATIAAARPRHFLPVAPVALVAFLTGAVLGASVGFASASAPSRAPSGGPTREVGSQRLEPIEEGRSGLASTRAGLWDHTAVLVVAGFSSHYDGGAVTLAGTPADSVVVAYSYRGSTAAGLPLAYGASATHAALPLLAELMAEQVDELARTTGRRVDIVAASEGTAVLDTYLASARHPPVGVAVLVSPLLHAGDVSYPPSGRSGWGIAAGQGLQLLSSWLAPISTVDLSPQQPFLRSLISLRPALAGVRRCAPPGCSPREVEVVPLADAVAGAPEAPRGATLVVVADFHGSDLGDPAVGSVVSAALSGRPVRGSHTEEVLSEVIAGLASAWCVPALSTAS